VVRKKKGTNDNNGEDPEKEQAMKGVQEYRDGLVASEAPPGGSSTHAVETDSDEVPSPNKVPEQNVCYLVKARNSLDHDAEAVSLDCFVLLPPLCTYATARKEIKKQLVPDKLPETDEWRFLYSKQLGQITLQQESSLTVPSMGRPFLVLSQPRALSSLFD
jgi:hypothetical protein